MCVAVVLYSSTAERRTAFSLQMLNDNNNPQRTTVPAAELESPSRTCVLRAAPSAWAPSG